MQTALAIAATIATFVLMSFIVEGNRTPLTPDQTSMQGIVDAQFYMHQREEYSTPAGGK